MRWLPSVLFLLVRLGLSLCAVAFVLGNVQDYYTPMSDFAGTGRPPGDRVWVPPSLRSLP